MYFISYATVKSRVAARIIDVGFIVIAEAILAGWLLKPDPLFHTRPLFNTVPEWLYNITLMGTFGLVLPALYFSLLTWKFGATSGKRYCHIAVTTNNQQPASLRKLLVRESTILLIPFLAVTITSIFVKFFDGHFSVGFGLIIYILVLIAIAISMTMNEEGEAIHDRIAGTRVFKIIEP